MSFLMPDYDTIQIMRARFWIALGAHFMGTMRGGKPVEWTVESTSVLRARTAGV